MRMLVFGGTRFLSRAVALHAVTCGHDVVCAAPLRAPVTTEASERTPEVYGGVKVASEDAVRAGRPPAAGRAHRRRGGRAAR